MQTLLAILQLFPLILSAVTALENAIPQSGAGKEKLALILDVVQAAFDASSDLQKAFSWEKLAGIVVTIIGKVVALMNALGVFKKAA